MGEEVKMCGDCRNHQGTACDVHAGVFLDTARACDNFTQRAYNIEPDDDDEEPGTAA